MRRFRGQRGLGPGGSRAATLIALAAASAAALSGCHRAQGLDLVNDCDAPITVYGGEYNAAAGSTPNIYRLEPRETAFAYTLDGKPAIFYILNEGRDDWRGPVTVTPSTTGPETYRYELPREWCE